MNLKIKFECWWTDSMSINNRVIKQFVDLKDLEEYNFVTENPDFTIILGRMDFEKLETRKENTLYISQEPLWSPNEPKNNLHEFCGKILISDKSHYPNKSEYVQTLLPMLYGGRGETDDRKEWDWSYDNLNKKTYDKSKIISGIVRKDYGGHYHSIANKSEVIYGRRTELMETLSNNKVIDVFGTHWESNGSNIKGETWNKHVGLDDYKFSIACENSIQKNYVSEKFWDVILTESIPIYMGCVNIGEYIPVDCFISLNNKSMIEMVEVVNDVIDNDDYYYNKHINNVLRLKKEFFKSPKYNLWERVKQEINNI